MKISRNRSISLYFLTLFFIAGLGLFTFRFVTNSDIWAIHPINKHLTNDLKDYGEISDRNSVTLAKSENNKRVYNNDKDIRCSLLHTVGDNNSLISTSIQNLYKAELSGYNFITGVKSLYSFNLKKNISLTLDSTACKKAYKELEGKKGCVLVYNYLTGDILCIASTPTFDPYNPPKNIENNKEFEGVYLNRGLSSSFTPGSVFKIITSISALENFNDMQNKTYSCEKTFSVAGKNITCLSHHGKINFKDALTRSCNIYFAKLAIDLGNEKMTTTAKELQFNKSLAIDRLKTKQSTYNVANADSYSLGWSGVGQHTNLLNPIHMLTICGAIANNGTSVTPTIIKNISSDNQIPFIDKLNMFTPKKEEKKLIDKDIANTLKEMLKNAAKTNFGGTYFKNLNACLKTGTAEVGDDKLPNSWCSGFLDNEKYPFAFVVLVENAGFGSKIAVPIANEVLSTITKS